MAKDKPLSRIQRAIQQAIGEGRTVGADDDPAREQFPDLWEWLSTIYVGRDWTKDPATFTVQLGPEGVVISFSDRSLNQSCSVGCRHLGDVLGAIQAALIDPATAWRSWGKREPQLRKRKSGK